MCACSTSQETTRHFLLECPVHDGPRRNLHNIINPIFLQNNLINLNPEQKVKILLYGHPTLDFANNKALLIATTNFIKSSNRFSK